MSLRLDTLHTVQKRLGSASLIAVTKNQDSTTVREALAAGLRVFGENRVQEAQQKFPPLREEFPDLVLHLIGPLQTNKVAAAVSLFDVIQTVDRPKLAQELARALQKTERKPRLYIQVNLGLEPQKSGVPPEETASFLTYCRDVCALSISGLMGIPPRGLPPEPYFDTLHALAHTLSLPHISMGMSDDFETALACGATEVRLGSLLFGERL